MDQKEKKNIDIIYMYACVCVSFWPIGLLCLSNLSYLLGYSTHLPKRHHLFISIYMYVYLYLCMYNFGSLSCEIIAMC